MARGDRVKVEISRYDSGWGV
uniref:Translation initiation factor 1 n=1 Tax=Geranium sibiricum TaxID=345237 RepID=A0A7T4XAE9_9ROSI|nr:translation initiation factor 1 [Geranium sibiricum]QQD90189.1 translation initiation factor 1 [Geranium sibiricum]